MKKVDNLSKYDCELVDTNNLEHQTSAYYNAENYQPFVSDEDMSIPKEFDPYCVKINLSEDSMLNNEPMPLSFDSRVKNKDKSKVLLLFRK